MSRRGNSESLSITGGRVIDPASELDATTGVHVADGRIVSVGETPAGFEPERRIDATGQVVCPGLVDLCARLREPGHEHKATIASEARAAAAAGITTLCCPPDTEPVVDTPAVVELIRRRADECGLTQVVTLGALTYGLAGDQLTEMAALKAAGVVGVSNGLRPVENNLILRRALEYAATFDLTVFLHAEDAWLHNNGFVHEGAVATRLGIPGVPEAAETTAVACALALAEQIGVRLHFCRLSTTRAVQMVARAQFEGLPITVDVAAHQLHLSEDDVATFDPDCHVRPPLRTGEDRDGLRRGVARGTLGVICSDHQPHDAEAKRAPFIATAPGISALETLLPLTLELAESNVLPLADALSCLTLGPARVLGAEAGSLAVGAPADICVFDPAHQWTLSETAMVSRGHNTPFIGRPLTGRVTHTVRGGALVFQREE